MTQIIKQVDKVYLLEVATLAKFKQDEEVLLYLYYKINEEIISLVSAVPYENTKNNLHYKLFLKGGGINSFAKILTRNQSVQYHIKSRNVATHKETTYARFYLAALLIYIGEENLRQFYALCKLNMNLKNSFEELFLTEIWPIGATVNFNFLKEDILCMLGEGDLFLLTILLEKSGRDSATLILEALLEYSSPYFTCGNKTMCESIASIIKEFKPDIFRKLLLIAMRNFDEIMLEKLMALYDKPFTGAFFLEVLKLSPHRDCAKCYEKIVLDLLERHPAFIEWQDSDKGLYPFFILLLNGSSEKEALAKIILAKSSIKLKRQYLVWLYEHANEVNWYYFYNVLSTALAVEDVLFVIKACEVSMPSFLHQALEASPVNYLTYAIEENKYSNEDVCNLILFNLPDHWRVEYLTMGVGIKKYAYELITAASMSFNSLLKELTLKIVKSYLENILGVDGYKKIIDEHKNEEVIQADNATDFLTYFSLEIVQPSGSKRNASGAAIDGASANMSAESYYKRSRKGEENIEGTIYEEQQASVLNDSFISSSGHRKCLGRNLKAQLLAKICQL